MKISEVIELLTERLESSGDQEVVVWDSDSEECRDPDIEYFKWTVGFKPDRYYY